MLRRLPASALLLAALAACGGGDERPAPRPAAAAAPAATAAPGLPQREPVGSRWDKPGFWTREVDGRLWVFRSGSRELAAFRRDGPPPRQVTRLGVGPNGMAVKATDASIIDAYLAAK